MSGKESKASQEPSLWEVYGPPEERLENASNLAQDKHVNMAELIVGSAFERVAVAAGLEPSTAHPTIDGPRLRHYRGLLGNQTIDPRPRD